jgi:hypothetical protein
MMRAPLLFALALCATLSFAGAASAQRVFGEPFTSRAGSRSSSSELTASYSTGLRFSVAPGFFVPFERGDIGFSIMADVRYGFDVYYAVIAPGARFAGFFSENLSVLTYLGTLRVTFPVGPVGPFITGGVGPGHVNSPARFGAAYTVGGGLMVHFGRRVGIGAEISYLGVTRVNFKAMFFGPTLLIAI